MISVVSSVHNRDIDLWYKSLAMQTAIIELILVVYDDDKNYQPPEDFPHIHGIIQVDKIDGPYPEAWLKNIGIKHARGDVIACTNIDIIYTENFFQTIEDNCSPGTLVQATRFDIPELSTVEARDGGIYVSTEGENLHIICQPVDTPVIGKASGDCQCMMREDWEDLKGYNENMKGWGGLDVDLECRAILSGRNVFQTGFSTGVVHYHVWHPRDRKANIANGHENHEVLKAFLKGNLQNPNETWGEYSEGAIAHGKTSHTDIPVS